MNWLRYKALHAQRLDTIFPCVHLSNQLIVRRNQFRLCSIALRMQPRGLVSNYQLLIIITVIRPAFRLPAGLRGPNQCQLLSLLAFYLPSCWLVFCPLM